MAPTLLTRRQFLQTAAPAGLCSWLSWAWFTQPTPIFAQEEAPPPTAVNPHFQTIDWAMSFSLTSAEFAQRANELSQQNYWLTWLYAGRGNNNQPIFSAIWQQQPGSPEQIIVLAISSGDYERRNATYRAEGYQLLCLSGYESNGQLTYCVVWSRSAASNTTTLATRTITERTYPLITPQAEAAGYSLQALHPYNFQGQMRYTALFTRPAPPALFLPNLSLAEFNKAIEQRAGLGYRPVSASIYPGPINPRVAVVLQEQKEGETVTKAGLSVSQLAQEASTQAQAGGIPQCVTGYAQGVHTHLAAVWYKPARQWRTAGDEPGLWEKVDEALQTFIQERGVRAGAVAITQAGKVAFTRAYQWDVPGRPAVTPTSLFRIASVSKPITATAILKLAQDGALTLADKLTDWLTFTPRPNLFLEPRLGDITILQLLQHLAGFAPNTPFDPLLADTIIAPAVNKPLPITLEDIFTYMCTAPLANNPGTVFAYNNFGYALLGEIVAVASGQPYAQYVQQAILQPLGITKMQIGGSLLSEQLPDEVWYEANVPVAVPDVFSNPPGRRTTRPYGGFNLTNLQAAGGWVASVTDLAKFALLFDPAGGYPVLTAETIALAQTPPAIEADDNGLTYTAGWYRVPVANGQFNFVHDGNLPGSAAILCRRPDGLSWAVLLNRDAYGDGSNYAELYNVIEEAIE